MAKPDYESLSRDALIARTQIAEEESSFYKRIVEANAPAFEAQERVVKFLVAKPDMLVEGTRVYETLRYEVPVAAKDWQAAQKNLCHHHGIMRVHKKSQNARYAGVVSLDFERLVLLEGVYAFLTPSVQRLTQTAAEMALDSGRIDTERTDIIYKYPWVSPSTYEGNEANNLRFGVTTAALRRLGLMALDGTQ